jgi:hypothetical protein
MGILEGLKNAWRKYQERKMVEEARRIREKEHLDMVRKEAYVTEIGKIRAHEDVRLQKLREQERQEEFRRQRAIADRLVFGPSPTKEQREFAERMTFGHPLKKEKIY